SRICWRSSARSGRGAEARGGLASGDGGAAARNAASGDDDRLDALRQGPQEEPAVGLGLDARVEDDDTSLVLVRADEAAEALLEADDGAGDGVLGEGGAAAGLDALAPRLGEGAVGRVEGEARDDDVAEGPPADVDALPEAGGAEEDGVAALAEALEDGGARAVGP